MVRVIHHRSRCIGCGYCVDADIFRWYMNSKDGRATLRDATEKSGIHSALLPDIEYDTLMEAADVCPVHIIRIERV